MKFRKRVISALTIYLILISLLFLFQRKIQYLPAGTIQPLSVYNLEDFQEKIIETEDNIKIFSWYKKPKSKDNKIILYFHGNGGSLADRVYRFRKFVDNDYGVLAISYRGYRKSEGKPSENGLILDAKAALKFLYDQGFSDQDIIIYGESLGSGVASQIGVDNDFYMIVLESPYSSIISVAKSSYWYVPLSLLLKDKFESIKYLPKIKSPIIIFHGKKDRVVKFSEGQKVFAAINSKKKMIIDDELGHVEFDPQFVLSNVEDFISEIYLE